MNSLASHFSLPPISASVSYWPNPPGRQKAKSIGKHPRQRAGGEWRREEALQCGVIFWWFSTFEFSVFWPPMSYSPAILEGFYFIYTFISFTRHRGSVFIIFRSSGLSQGLACERGSIIHWMNTNESVRKIMCWKISVICLFIYIINIYWATTMCHVLFWTKRTQWTTLLHIR